MTDGGEHARELSKRGERRKFVKCHPARRQTNYKKKRSADNKRNGDAVIRSQWHAKKMPRAWSKASNEGQPPPNRPSSPTVWRRLSEFEACRMKNQQRTPHCHYSAPVTCCFPRLLPAFRIRAMRYLSTRKVIISYRDPCSRTSALFPWRSLLKEQFSLLSPHVDTN